MPSFISCLCVLAALRGSSCSVSFEKGKHTEGTLGNKHALACFIYLFMYLLHTHIYTHTGAFLGSYTLMHYNTRDHRMFSTAVSVWCCLAQFAAAQLTYH